MDTKTIIARVRGMSNEDIARVAQLTGIGRGTLMKIKYLQTTDPRMSTIDALREFFRLAA